MLKLQDVFCPIPIKDSLGHQASKFDLQYQRSLMMMDNSLIHLRGKEVEGKRKGGRGGKRGEARQNTGGKRREEWTYKKMKHVLNSIHSEINLLSDHRVFPFDIYLSLCESILLCQFVPFNGLNRSFYFYKYFVKLAWLNRHIYMFGVKHLFFSVDCCITKELEMLKTSIHFRKYIFCVSIYWRVFFLFLCFSSHHSSLNVFKYVFQNPFCCATFLCGSLLSAKVIYYQVYYIFLILYCAIYLQ